jgi:hypothetical protein
MQIGWTAVVLFVALLAAGIACIALGEVTTGIAILVGASTLLTGSYLRPAVSRSIPPPPPGGGR